MSNRTWLSVAVGATLFVVSLAKADTIFTTELTGTPNPADVFQDVTFIATIMASSPSGNTITITNVNYMFDYGDGLNSGPQVNGGPFPEPTEATQSAVHDYPAAGVYDVRFTGTVTYTISCATPPCVDPSMPVQATFPETVVATATIPEPASGVLAGIGIAAIAAYRRRTRRS
jgi:hypothetical protein